MPMHIFFFFFVLNSIFLPSALYFFLPLQSFIFLLSGQCPFFFAFLLLELHYLPVYTQFNAVLNAR
jgi:hypothetical protein